MKKYNNVVVNVTKISDDMKNKNLLTIEKYMIEWKKTLHYDYKKLLFSKNFNDLESSLDEE